MEDNNEIMEKELDLGDTQELKLDDETMDQLNSLASEDGGDSSDKLSASDIAVLIGAIAGGFMLTKWLLEKACRGCKWAVKKLKAHAEKLKAKKAAKENEEKAPAAPAELPAPPVEETTEEKTEE